MQLQQIAKVVCTFILTRYALIKPIFYLLFVSEQHSAQTKSIKNEIYPQWIANTIVGILFVSGLFLCNRGTRHEIFFHTASLAQLGILYESVFLFQTLPELIKLRLSSYALEVVSIYLFLSCLVTTSESRSKLYSILANQIMAVSNALMAIFHLYFELNYVLVFTYSLLSFSFLINFNLKPYSSVKQSVERVSIKAIIIKASLFINFIVSLLYIDLYRLFLLRPQFTEGFTWTLSMLVFENFSILAGLVYMLLFHQNIYGAKNVVNKDE